MSPGVIARRSLLVAAGGLAVPGLAHAAGARPRVAIRTGKGTIILELEAQRAPISTANFLRYVDTGHYDGGIFYRAAHAPDTPTEGQIVAHPNPRSHPFAPIAHESTTQTGLRHLTGTLSLGRFAPGTATGDFFICANPEPYLDAHPGAKGDNLGFAAFGQVVSGMSVVRRILASPANGHSPFPDQRGQWLKPPITILGASRV